MKCNRTSSHSTVSSCEVVSRVTSWMSPQQVTHLLPMWNIFMVGYYQTCCIAIQIYRGSYCDTNIRRTLSRYKYTEDPIAIQIYRGPNRDTNVRRTQSRYICTEDPIAIQIYGGQYRDTTARRTLSRYKCTEDTIAI